MKDLESIPDRTTGLCGVEKEPLPPTLLANLQELAQSQFDLSNERKSREWQRKAHAHAWAGICAAIRVVKSHYADAAEEPSPLLTAEEGPGRKPPTSS